MRSPRIGRATQPAAPSRAIADSSAGAQGRSADGRGGGDAAYAPRGRSRTCLSSRRSCPELARARSRAKRPAARVTGSAAHGARSHDPELKSARRQRKHSRAWCRGIPARATSGPRPRSVPSGGQRHAAIDGRGDVERGPNRSATGPEVGRATGQCKRQFAASQRWARRTAGRTGRARSERRPLAPGCP